MEGSQNNINTAVHHIPSLNMQEETSNSTHLRCQTYPADLSDSPDLDPGCPAPEAGSPAGSAAAGAPLALELLVEGTYPPGSG